MRSLLMRRLTSCFSAGLLIQLAVVDLAVAQEASATAEPSGDKAQGASSRPAATAEPSGDAAQGASSKPAATAEAAKPAANAEAAKPAANAEAAKPAANAGAAKPAADADAKPKATVRSSYAREILSRFSPAITFFYAASPTDTEVYQFRHQLGFIFGLDYAATDTLILSSEGAVYRELGEPIERFVASNWEFGVTKMFQIPYAGTLLPTFYFNLPTNPDDREYLTYRGAVGLDVELRKSSLYSPRKNHVFGASVGLGTLRRIYEYDTNRAGFNNQAWQYSMYLSANYKYRDWLLFLLKFGNNWNWNVNGNRANDTYRLTASVNYSPYKQFWLALAWDNADRTFLYDQVTSNVNLYSPQGTNIILWLTYLPQISKISDLAR